MRLLAILALVVAALVIVAATLLAIRQHFLRLVRTALRFGNGLIHSTQFLGQIGENIREFKDQQLEDWVGKRIPIPANVLTVVRFFVLIGSLYYIWVVLFAWAAGCFIGGWLLDFIDGLKARSEEKRAHQQAKALRGRGRLREAAVIRARSIRARRFGKYADPYVDIPHLIAHGIALDSSIHTFHLEWNWHLGWLFSGALVVRVVLYGIYRLIFANRIRKSILPRTVEGQYKTVFVVIGFGLILVDPTRQVIGFIPELLIGCAVCLEPISLLVQGKRVIQLVRKTPVRIRPGQQPAAVETAP